jgi:exodeoxyribonuclease V gamma subunit
LTSLDGLERWSAANRLITARLAGHTNAEWARYERALGAVPAGGLGVASIAEIAGAVDALLDAAATLGVDPSIDDRYPIEVELSDRTRVVGVIEGRCAAPNPGPATVVFSRAAPRQHLAGWLDLVALVANDPATNWRSVVVRRPEKGDVPDALQLVALGDTPEDRHARALGALEVAVDCYRRGLREPVPLFSSFSYKLYTQRAVPNDWQAFGGLGDGDDEAHRLAFGGLDFKGVCAIPARPDDPPGPATGRAERFARYLWSAVEASARPPQ